MKYEIQLIKINWLYKLKRALRFPIKKDIIEIVIENDLFVNNSKRHIVYSVRLLDKLPDDYVRSITVKTHQERIEK